MEDAQENIKHVYYGRVVSSIAPPMGWLKFYTDGASR